MAELEIAEENLDVLVGLKDLDHFEKGEEAVKARELCQFQKLNRNQTIVECGAAQPQDQ